MTEEQLNFINNRVNTLIDKMNKNIITLDEYRELQIFLVVCNYIFKDKYPVCKTSITGNRAIFFSDTHLGNIYQNPRLVYTVYNVALQNNIKNIFHLGDLIEGTPHDEIAHKTLEEFEREFSSAMDFIPNDVTTRLLLGNHDFWTIRKFSNIGLKYFNEKRLQILGLKDVILEWDNLSILLNHDCPFVETVKTPVDLTLKGHTHLYREDLNNRIIYLTSLCQRKSTLNRTDSFIVADRVSETELLVDMYEILEDGNIRRGSSNLLTVKDNEKVLCKLNTK